MGELFGAGGGGHQTHGASLFGRGGGVGVPNGGEFWIYRLRAAFAVGATNYSFGVAVRPGPGYFPFGLGIILALLGVVVLFSAFKQERKGGDPIGKIPWRPLLCVVGAIVFFGFFLPRLGFVISFPIMIMTIAISTIYVYLRYLL